MKMKHWLLLTAGALVVIGFIMILPSGPLEPPPNRFLMSCIGVMFIALIVGILYVERLEARRGP